MNAKLKERDDIADADDAAFDEFLHDVGRRTRARRDRILSDDLNGTVAIAVWAACGFAWLAFVFWVLGR